MVIGNQANDFCAGVNLEPQGLNHRLRDLAPVVVLDGGQVLAQEGEALLSPQRVPGREILPRALLAGYVPFESAWQPS